MNQFPSRILVNSLPKSGTHLLTKAVELFGYQEYMTHHDNRHQTDSTLPLLLNYRQAKLAQKIDNPQQANDIGIGAFSPYYVNADSLRYWLEQLAAKQYIQGHLPWHPQLSDLLDSLDYRYVVIIRDPRAVVASLLPFIMNAAKTDMGAHFLAADFEPLSFRQRLDFILDGGFAKQANLAVQAFSEVFYAMLAWQQQTGCLLLRFEDLIGEQGGGDNGLQYRSVVNIAEHLGYEADHLSEQQIASIYSPKARTFRSGQIKSWQQNLSDQDAQHLDSYCRPLCKAAGYI